MIESDFDGQVEEIHCGVYLMKPRDFQLEP
jgi:hypothetical protein